MFFSECNGILGRDEVSLIGMFFSMVAPTALFSLYPTPEMGKGKLVMESEHRKDVSVLFSTRVWREAFLFCAHLVPLLSGHAGRAVTGEVSQGTEGMR